jgi:heterodisulfide reductase subunit C
MDFSPRRIIALVREGFREDALSSKTIWLCASCYSCAVHCPRHIHVTDVMYSLKREAIERRVYPRRFPVPVLAQEFVRMVRRNGRNSEFWLILRTALRSNPLMLLGMVRTGWDLMRTGRFTLRRERVTGGDSFDRELARLEAVR